MRWITGINIENYRAFSKPEPIVIPYKHNLLIYGENGSGKSSLYHAIKAFLTSSDFSTPTFTLNDFCKTQGKLDGLISITITHKLVGNQDEEIKYLFSEPPAGSTNKKSEIQLANKAKGFLDYKRILKAHALDVPAAEKPNIFDLLLKDLLRHHRLPSPRGGTSTIELYSEYSNLSNILRTKRRNSRVYTSSKTELEKLDAEFNKLLISVFSEANNLLSTYFKNNLKLDISYSKLQVSDRKQMQERINLRVFYADNEIDNYHVFLNEARLSSLAICLYLASIKINPQPSDTLLILFLDDVFIGLDMSNRIPLLEIIKNEFIKNDFQIFISTYDRQWYELARYWFETNKCSVKCIEMFIGKDANANNMEFPVIVDSQMGYFATAKNHFERHDYPATANYLRKACEFEIKRILPRNKRLHANHETGEIHIIDKLEMLVDNFTDFITKNGLDLSPFRHFKTYKKLIFNPLSHDDLEAPHYKTEIEAGIALVEALKMIDVKNIYSIDSRAGLKPLKLGIRQFATTHMHHYEFFPLENLQLVRQNAGSVRITAIECNLKENGSIRKFNSIYEAFNQILTESGYPATDKYDDFYNNISINSHRKLKDEMIFD